MTACDTCKEKDQCGDKKKAACTSDPKEPIAAPGLENPHPKARIRFVVGVCSGKGGVGKSFVSAAIAVALTKKGYNIGILDADITGPSIPRAFGLKGPLKGSEAGLEPAVTKTGIQVVSLNLLTDNETAPVLWRGPIVSSLVKQFWTEVIWKDVDVLLIDLPPGTGDVPLTVFQSIRLDGIVLVSTPQDLVSMIVGKAQNMADMMKVKILGFVENMSYLECEHCKNRHEIFGAGHTEKAAKAIGVPLFDRIPINPAISRHVDAGKIETIDVSLVEETCTGLIAALGLDKNKGNG